MRIAITTMMWRRFDVFCVWAESILRLQRDFPNTELIVVVAGSEKGKSRKLCESFGFHYIEVPNRPIGRKANLRLLECKKYSPDFVYLCGSDDIISTQTFRKYLSYANHGYEEVSLLNLYYFNTLKNEFAFSRGYTGRRTGEPIAPFRMISKRLCNIMGWQGWNDKEKLFLDGHIYKRLCGIPHKRMVIDIKKNNDFALDIKTEINMTPFKWRNNYREDDVEIMKKALPKKEYNMIMDLLDRGDSDMTYNGIGYLK